jgi:microcystin-dependent protein
MSSPFLSQILMFGGNFAPKNYALCNGQTLAINQNQALFALLGTTYGGNGVSTFQLPNLQSNLPVGFGQGPGLSNYTLGQVGGVPTVTLTQATVPPHIHTFSACNSAGATNSPSVTGNVPGTPSVSGALFYATPPGNPPIVPTALGAATCPSIGGNQAHSNQMPSLCVTFAIALAGAFPSRN